MVKRWQLGACVLCVLCLAFTLGIAWAQEQEAAGSAVKEELQSDMQQIKQERHMIHENAQAAKEGERQLKQQIDAAITSGDFETAKELRGQLHTTHQENIQQMHQDIQQIREAKQELRNDFKEARQEGKFTPGIGPKNHPGAASLAKDKIEDIRDRRENIRDRREDIRDRREDIKDKQEDIRDKKEDILDRRYDGGRKDRLEDIRDKREDIRDRREDIRDRRENARDRMENIRDRKEDMHERKVSPAAGSGQHQAQPVKAPQQHHPAGNRPAAKRQGGGGRHR